MALVPLSGLVKSNWGFRAPPYWAASLARSQSGVGRARLSGGLGGYPQVRRGIRRPPPWGTWVTKGSGRGEALPSAPFNLEFL